MDGYKTVGWSTSRWWEVDLQQEGVRVDCEKHPQHIDAPHFPDRVHAAHAEPHARVIKQVEGAEAQEARLGGRYAMRREEKGGVGLLSQIGLVVSQRLVSEWRVASGEW